MEDQKVRKVNKQVKLITTAQLTKHFTVESSSSVPS